MKIKFELNIYVYKNSMEKTPKRADQNLNSKDDRKIITQHEVIKPVGLREFMQEMFDNIKQFRSYNTMKNYETAIRSFLSFSGKQEIPINDITAERIAAWQMWLRQKGVCLNTISCYIRSLRSIYNYAVEKKAVIQQHPFDKAFTGKTKTESRSIEIEDIKQLKDLQLRKGTFLELTRDMFLFCFYALGMPFIDLVFLRKSQLSGDTLTYYRQKTGQHVNVCIEPCMREIIDKYATAGSDYVFPLITSTDKDIARKEYLRLLGRYNRALKRLAGKAGVKSRLTSYMARHTWASMAFQRNVDLPVISKALGHTNTHTTLLYIRGINDERLHIANKQLLHEMEME